MVTSVGRKKMLRRFVQRSIAGERLGFEAYVWAAQRVTGLILFAFLFLHLYTLSSVFGGAESYEKALGSMGTPFVKVGELLLVWVVLFHSLNGVRLVLFNFYPELNHKKLAYAIAAASLCLTLISVPFLI
jgi:succinate dehydrogenase / fumarate reductase cytochrome b subunit